ncbi:glycosyltransferase [Leptolyngbya sp. AN02str]|uniref:glycosyltransferase n=1 Tax=Leptolyngbya sp. AN02str TaxID=3423363 RepID=UPI003D324088
MMRVIASPAVNRHNPYNESLYSSVQALGVEVDHFSIKKLLLKHYDIWHFHWPERMLNDRNFIRSVFRSTALLAFIYAARLRGTKIVWTVHNLGSHERYYPKLEAWFWQQFIGCLHGYISLSHTAMAAAQERFPGLKRLPGFVVPHAHYRHDYPDDMTAQQARAFLGLDPSTPMMLLVGNLRRYKNAPQLVHLFRQLPNRDYQLYIVGKPSHPDIHVAIEQEAAADERVHLCLDFIPSDKMQLYLRAATLVVLPYQEILNSGSALLSLSFDCPVLVPQAGSLAELQDMVGKDWVRTYSGELTPDELQRAMDWAIATPRAAQAPLAAFENRTLGKKTIEAYQAIAASST